MKNKKLIENSNQSGRKNNLIKITPGILIIFGLIIGGVSASNEGLFAYRSFDDGTANDEAGHT